VRLDLWNTKKLFTIILTDIIVILLVGGGRMLYIVLDCIGFTFWFILLAPETVLVNARCNWLKFEYVKTVQLKVSFSVYYIEFEYIMTKQSLSSSYQC